MHEFSVCNLLKLTNPIKELSLNLASNDDEISWIITHQTTCNTKFGANLFTVSDFIKANQVLLQDIESDDLELVCRNYWHNIINVTSEWKAIINKKKLAVDQRTTYINCQPFALNAYAVVGNYLLKQGISSYRAQLMQISNIDWTEANPNWIVKKMALSGCAESLSIALQLTLKTHLNIQFDDDREVIHEFVLNEFSDLFNSIEQTLEVNVNDYESSCKYKRFN
ncbi:hypothetical protein C9J21_17920 [Photobacterium phosphoreum]|uniref:DNA sulfur modification protein DndB n=1 Tax=Photobacterium phosphoreum TaxID=659 RepID=UPI000D16F789|nr:DNA sulfur modification protein DndB [Photobacterium phosphoreum]PSW31227.1 hypothetical protein C9J21_17920 [Photobacterium phosphoreum]